MSHTHEPLVLSLLADVDELDQVEGWPAYLDTYTQEGRARIELALLVEQRLRNQLAADRNAQLVQLNAHLAQRNQLATQEVERLQQLNDQHDLLIAIGHRMANELERIADCCQFGSERSEAMIDASLNHHEDAPPERYARYLAILAGGTGPAPAPAPSPAPEGGN